MWISMHLPGMTDEQIELLVPDVVGMCRRQACF